MTKIDIHVHTTTSSCSIFRPDELISDAVRMKIPIVVTTNHHDSYGGAQYLKTKLELHGIQFFAGLEMTCEWGDFLMFGENLREFNGYTGKFPVKLLPRDDIAVIWAHPYRFYSSKEIDRVKYFAAPFIDAVEAINGNCLRSCPEANIMAAKLGQELGKPLVAGSDAHSAKMFFMTGTLFEDPIYTYSDFVRSIKLGKVKIEDLKGEVEENEYSG